MTGTVTGAGNPTFAAEHAAATRNATAVERLLDAGASVIGKTITDELSYSLSGTNVHYGMPRNVNAPGRVPGGSSAGSAAAVAAGLADLALGIDTGGSVRIPASYCGIYGWRPTYAAVPIDGVVALSPSFDVVGLFAANADLLVHGADALLEPAGRARRLVGTAGAPGARRRAAARLVRRGRRHHRPGGSAPRCRRRDRAGHRSRCRGHRVPPPPGPRVVGGPRCVAHRRTPAARTRGSPPASRPRPPSPTPRSPRPTRSRGGARRGVRGDARRHRARGARRVRRRAVARWRHRGAPGPPVAHPSADLHRRARRRPGRRRADGRGERAAARHRLPRRTRHDRESSRWCAIWPRRRRSTRGLAAADGWG